MDFYYILMFITIILEFFTVVVQWIFVENLLNSRNRKRVSEVLAWLAYAGVFNFLSYRIGNNAWINFASFAVPFFILLRFLYRDKIRYQFFVTIFLYLAGMCSELVGYYLLKEMKIYQDIQYVEVQFYILNSIISKLLWFIVIKILLLFARKSIIAADLQDWLEAVLVPTGSILILVFCFPVERLLSMDENRNMPMGLIGIICLLTINIVTYYLYEKGKVIAEKRVSERMLREQCNYYMKQCEENQKLWIGFSRFRHDIKQKYIYIQTLLEMKDYSALEKYCQDNFGYLIVRKNIAASGNIYFDSIINYKAELAGQFQIKFELEMNVPYNCRINGEEVSLCLGNLLDNAIEATKEVQEDRRKISIAIKVQGRNLYMAIRNPYTSPRIKAGRNYLTTKREKSEHGWGLKIIGEIVNKYNGEMDIQDDNNIFSVVLLLYEIVEKI